jgi:hypothetical protein
MSIYDQVKEIAEDHCQDIGVIVVNIKDYLELWEYGRATSNPPPMYGFVHQCLNVLDTPVIQRDEHEGPPQWVPEHVCKSWFPAVSK